MRPLLKDLDLMVRDLDRGAPRPPGRFPVVGISVPEPLRRAEVDSDRWACMLASYMGIKFVRGRDSGREQKSTKRDTHDS